MLWAIVLLLAADVVHAGDTENLTALICHSPEFVAKLLLKLGLESSGVEVTEQVLDLQYRSMSLVLCNTTLYLKTYLSLGFASLVCLALTLAAYGVTSAMRNLHGRCLVVQASCSLLAMLHVQVLLLLVMFRPIVQNIALYLVATGVPAMYFFMVSSYMVNTMAFEIWRTFTKEVATPQPRPQTKRLILYCAYAFLVPAAQLALLAYFYIVAETSISQFLSEIGWYLLYVVTLPMLALMSPNLLFFVSTAARLHGRRRDAEAALNSIDSKTHNGAELRKFQLYAKLFVAMGGSMLPVLVYETLYQLLGEHVVPDVVQIVVECLFMSQGVFVFVATVLWTSQHRKPLVHRLFCIKT